MSRGLLVAPVLWLAWLSGAAAAEEIEPLDAEFLEYLASFGSDEETWALFTEEEPVADAADRLNKASEPGRDGDDSKEEAAAKPADKR
jgi:hypothetical protein